MATEKTKNIRISNLYDTKKNWETVESNAILKAGEIAFEVDGDNNDHVKMKVGNGATDFGTLPYFTDYIDNSNIHTLYTSNFTLADSQGQTESLTREELTAIKNILSNDLAAETERY